ncbi:unnamed protein product, partial [Prorocentrum cordatum]
FPEEPPRSAGRRLRSAGRRLRPGGGEQPGRGSEQSARWTKEIKARRRRRTKKKMPRARWREDGRPGASWPAASTPPWHGRPARIGAGQRPLPRAAWGRLGAEDEGEDQIGRG